MEKHLLQTKEFSTFRCSADIKLSELKICLLVFGC